MSAPPGFNPDTSLLQQNSSAPIVPFRGGGTPVSLDAFYQALLKTQSQEIRTTLPENIADITNFTISVEDGKFVLKMKVKGKKKEAAAEETETAAAIADVAALEAATEAREAEEAIAAVAASEVATKAETEEEAAKKKAEEEEILKKAREFLILEAARAFLRKERNNERKRGTRELINTREEAPGMEGEEVPFNLASSYLEGHPESELPSSSQLVTPPSGQSRYANKRAALNKAVRGAQEDSSSITGENNNDRSENEFEANSDSDDVSDVEQVIRDYEDATNVSPDLKAREVKKIETLRKALTVIGAARQFARLGAVGKKRKIAEGRTNSPLVLPTGRRRRFAITPAPRSSLVQTASNENVAEATRLAPQINGTRQTVNITGAKSPTSLHLPPPPSNPTQKSQ